jgi:hypothetical protein
MDYKESILSKLKNRAFCNIYQLYSTVHEIEMDEFRKAFFALGRDSVSFEESENHPMVTITAHEEPLQKRVLGIRKEEGNNILIVCEYYGSVDSYCLCDVEKGHLDFLKDYLE